MSKMIRYNQVKQQLRARPRTWLVTGAAGFIGSNLVEELLGLGQLVVGLDNFATGHRHNLEDVRRCVGEEAWENFRFIEASITDLSACYDACEGVDFVMHQAALGSVPRSIKDPIGTNASNVSGFLNMLEAARSASVSRFVYAASSSTYGDHPGLPKVENIIGRPLSPYAVTKYVDELYAQVFGRCYGTETIGLRYFNVFGPRQDPDGAYAAVIPRWIGQLMAGTPCRINGDGLTSRDFCYVDNAVQANILAATTIRTDAVSQVFNVAYGGRTSLTHLYIMIREALAAYRPEVLEMEAIYEAFREGDVRHSQADIGKARKLLGYDPAYSVSDGLLKAVSWYAHQEAGTGEPAVVSAIAS
jgi:UDP-N-acetylglucosamine/UDP-N-acetylgalactosamine 4-epimerase